MAADTSNPALQQTWHEVAKKDSDLNWCLFGFEGASKSLEVVGKGSGGFNELKENLDDDRVLFGAFRVVGIDDRGTTVSRRTKFIFFTFIGENVPVMKKARVSIQRAEVIKVFDGIQVSFDISDKESFTQLAVMKKLCASGGAHKPTYYEFGPDDKLNLDFYEVSAD